MIVCIEESRRNHVVMRQKSVIQATECDKQAHNGAYNDEAYYMCAMSYYMRCRAVYSLLQIGGQTTALGAPHTLHTSMWSVGYFLMAYCCG